MKLWPKNWGDFQHYKDRSPTWIKLHASILDDYDFCMMQVASRALAPMLWLLASRYEKGEINESPVKLAFKLRMTHDDFLNAVKPLLDNGFFEADSDMLAECLQNACLEERRERGEREKEESKRESRESQKSEPKEKTEPESKTLPPSAPTKSCLKQSLIDLGVPEQVAKDYLAIRTAKKSPLTHTAIAAIQREAAKAGITFADAVGVSTENGWQGFKADWYQKLKPSTGMQNREAIKQAGYAAIFTPTIKRELTGQKDERSIN